MSLLTSVLNFSFAEQQSVTHDCSSNKHLLGEAQLSSACLFWYDSNNFNDAIAWLVSLQGIKTPVYLDCEII